MFMRDVTLHRETQCTHYMPSMASYTRLKVTSFSYLAWPITCGSKQYLSKKTLEDKVFEKYFFFSTWYKHQIFCEGETNKLAPICSVMGYFTLIEIRHLQTPKGQKNTFSQAVGLRL